MNSTKLEHSHGFLECSDRVAARHAKGRFDVANIDMVDVLHIVSSE